MGFRITRIDDDRPRESFRGFIQQNGKKFRIRSNKTTIAALIPTKEEAEKLKEDFKKSSQYEKLEKILNVTGNISDEKVEKQWISFLEEKHPEYIPLKFRKKEEIKTEDSDIDDMAGVYDPDAMFVELNNGKYKVGKTGAIDKPKFRFPTTFPSKIDAEAARDAFRNSVQFTQLGREPRTEAEYKEAWLSFMLNYYDKDKMFYYTPIKEQGKGQRSGYHGEEDDWNKNTVNKLNRSGKSGIAIVESYGDNDKYRAFMHSSFYPDFQGTRTYSYEIAKDELKRVHEYDRYLMTLSLEEILKPEMQKEISEKWQEIRNETRIKFRKKEEIKTKG